MPTDATSGAIGAVDDAAVRVFMSYRRTDDANFTGRFHDKLIGVFGDANVFRDIDSIPAGTRFEDVISDQLAEVDAVVALIGPTWSTRIDGPNDFVRMEIAHALERGTPVIPVIIEDTPLPVTDALPADLLPLLGRQAVRVRRDPDFHRDASRVIDGVREAVQVKRRREADVRRAAEREAARKQAEQEAERAQAARRRELEAELAAAEARAAEDRRVAEALEVERAARAAELARLEEEATQRRIADERAQLSALAESQAQREREAAEAAARAEALRQELDEIPDGVSDAPPPISVTRADVVPVDPPRPDQSEAAVEAPPRTSTSRASKSELLAGALLLVAFVLAVRTLFIDREDGSTAFSGPWSTDVVSVVLTVGLLAPFAAFWRGMHVPGVLAGVGIGFVAYQTLIDTPWAWSEGYGFPQYAIPIAVLLAAAWVAVHSGSTRDPRRVSHRPSRILQAVAALATLAATWMFVDRLIEWYDPDPNLIFVILACAVLMLVLSVLLPEGTTVALAVLALESALLFCAMAIADVDLRDRLLNITIASAVLAGAAGWRARHAEPVADQKRSAAAASNSA